MSKGSDEILGEYRTGAIMNIQARVLLVESVVHRDDKFPYIKFIIQDAGPGEFPIFVSRDDVIGLPLPDVYPFNMEFKGVATCEVHQDAPDFHWFADLARRTGHL